MKLWKMNAILLIISISICSCFESEGEKTIEQNSKHTDKFSKPSSESMYKENDLYLNKLEKEENEKKILGHQTFIQTDGPTKQESNNTKQETKNTKQASTNTKQASTKTKPSNKNSEKSAKFKFLKMPNQKLKMENCNKGVFEKCKKKKGCLYLMQDQKNLHEFRLFPIFVSLNLNTINLSLSEEEKNLFNSIKLDKIHRIVQQDSLKNENCFNLVLNEYQNKDKLINKGTVILCADSNDIMNSWIEAIQSFKECKVNVSNVDSNKKVLVDFNKINELLKDVGTTAMSGDKTNQSVKSLYYDNSPTILKSPAKNQSDKMLQIQISKIREEMKKGRLIQNQMQRKKARELKEAKKASEEIKRKQEMIQKIINQRFEKEKEKEEKLIKQEHKTKELELLKAVTHKIQNMQKKEYVQFNKKFDKEIRQEKTKAKQVALNTMHLFVNAEKLTDYDDCTDTKLLGFKDKEYIKNICMKYYGEHSGAECSNQEKFCSMCCAHHVGVNFMDKLVDCKSTCSNLIKGFNFKNKQTNKNKHHKTKY